MCPWVSLDSLGLRRRVAGLCMLYKLYHNSDHYLNELLPPLVHRRRNTRAAVAAHSLELSVVSCRTAQFARCFVPRVVGDWNELPDEVFSSGTLDGFKRAVNISLQR